MGPRLRGGDAFFIVGKSDIYHPPVKRSMTIAGHQTSISLEPIFWDALKAAADGQALPINALVAQIDVERLGSVTPCGLASAVRIWLAADAKKVPSPKRSDGTIATLGENARIS